MKRPFFKKQSWNRENVLNDYSQEETQEELGLGLFLILFNLFPHFRELFFTDDAHKLELRSRIEEGADEGVTDENKKTKKIIDLEGNKE